MSEITQQSSSFLNLWISRSFFLSLTTTRKHPGEGNGTPLQYSCLENPMDGGAWQAAVHGVAKSGTRLKRLSSSSSSSYFLAILPGTHEIMINLFYFIDPPFLINKIVTRLDKGLNKIFGKRLAHSGNAINKSTLF